MLYKITNLLSTSVTVEDLGIILPARGSCNVRADVWSGSNDGRDLEARRWIRADKQFVAGRPPVATVPHRPAPVVVPPVPLDPPLPESGIPTPMAAPPVSVSQESFDRFLKNQEEIMKMMTGLAGSVPAGIEKIEKRIQDMPAPAVIPFRPGMNQPHAHEFSSAAAGADPMFIPSRIVPDDAKSAIKVQEGEAKADVSSATDALKKLRGKKP
jgi:hypothetical protein